MIVFVDTSAFYAMASATDMNHKKAARTVRSLLDGGHVMTSSSYALAETLGLLQHRLGVCAAADFADRVLPYVDVVWIGPDLHGDAMRLLREIERRDVNIVDCCSFAVMRRLGIPRVFAFDPDFTRQGFQLYEP